MRLPPTTLSPALRAMRPAGGDGEMPWYEAPWRFAPVDPFQTALQSMLPFYKPPLEVIDERSLGGAVRGPATAGQPTSPPPPSDKPVESTPPALWGEGAPLLFASCVPVRGATRALIIDLEKRRALPIPLAWEPLLTQHRGERLEALKARRPEAEGAAIDALFARLLVDGMAFLTTTPERFPPLALPIERPHRLSHAILDRDASSSWDLGSVFRQLDALGCEHALVRLAGIDPLHDLDGVLEALGRRRPATLSAWIGWREGVTVEALEARCAAHPRLLSVIVFGAPWQGEGRRARSGVGNILFLERPLELEKPPLPTRERLTIGTALFAEAHHANPFFRGKIAVTATGMLQPSPFTGPVLGQVDETPIAVAVDHPARLALEQVCKDRIEPCRGCEYRYLCLDPLPPRARPDGGWERPEPCGLGPVMT